MAPTDPLLFAAHLVLFFALILLSALSLNLIALAGVFLATRRMPLPAAAALDPANLPRVLVQLPVFNEHAVLARIVHAAATLDWPRDRLRIQLLDDSTDPAAIRAAAVLVDRLQAGGVPIEHLHRRDRRGFKAGALAAGLQIDDSPFVAIFDADFVPAPDYLRRAIPVLAGGPNLAFVQARWEHLNPRENYLTRAQSMMLDAHFGIEQAARSRSGLMLPFNGTCGTWRRAAIDSAGGWSADTLCEDLDLSVRARLAGWRAAFLPQLTVPGELPATLAAWRTQQFRWTKGFAQVGRKLIGRVWRSDLPLPAKLAFTLQTGQPMCFPLAALSLLGTFALLLLEAVRPGSLSAAGVAMAGMGVVGSLLFVALGQAALRRGGWLLFPLRFAMILLLNSGLVISNTRAVVEGLAGRASAFVRTPKRGDGRRTPGERGGPTGAAELVCGAGLAGAVIQHAGWLSPLLSISILGLALVGAGLARERWAGLIAGSRTRQARPARRGE